MELRASKREVTGKATRRLRRQGLLPAVVYGQHASPLTVQLDAHEFERLYARTGRTHLIDLLVDGERPLKVLVKEVQRSPRKNTLVHVDFHQVSLREKTQVEVPVAIVGEPAPVMKGLADVLQVAHSLRVECLPTQIPEVIEVDVSGLDHVDAALRVADLKLPSGVSVVGDPEEVVVKLAARRVAEAAPAAAVEAAEQMPAPSPPGPAGAE